ncbi:hypothetical protein [Allobranchiibius huperziae]|uniref:Uncharacterized protein n=1 Tax=Allobranchiibius huperziae TaxID=1874116 RepID=A0A853DF07_9MICO|nr:hypothetical protein [Allobranchiibius huperziae]NYJ73644.1 hypothetical protein [Allobranchiibius huperziae]
MPKLRDEEMWVAACVENALLGVHVRQHDDGAQPSMYDLDLVRNDVVFGAMEVTAAADAASIEFWNLVNGSNNRWVDSDLAGGWLVTVTSTTRAKRLKKDLPGLLRAMEAGEADHQTVTGRMTDLGVVSAHQGSTDFPGSIYVTLQQDAERTGGAVPLTGNVLVHWFDEWIEKDAQRDNVEKLRTAELPEKHLFVLLPGFTTAPFGASDVLMRPDGPLPEVAPRLPEGITNIWFMSTWTTGKLFHFGHGGWTRSVKVLEVARS